MFFHSRYVWGKSEIRFLLCEIVRKGLHGETVWGSPQSSFSNRLEYCVEAHADH